ncbi:NAD-dependent epimerase/dehydratase family protein [Gordonia humi]|uniref:Nucleoside-diphosphate-sugar epimerase n=1 Tax=Gordonia humi TaxID=686429 RepID=A0A840F1G9_9ACTN|nr:NAD-dependent epimerase/dehydratase family protein [Gordonia humi]MBB4136323.1 nucleoside-diphosphate-sugar epimerase [Gordonia humi]
MQTILGAGGPIADGLVRELRRTYDGDIRIVSRRPAEVTAGDQLVAADLTDAAATSRAVAGSDVAYLTVGLPMDSDLWERRFPTMMRNVLDACIEHGAKLVFFDNTYMYPRTSTPQTESTAFEPVGRKSQVRAHIATMLLAEQAAGRVEALIARAPEFYGPGKTTSLTNTFVLDRIREGKRPMVPVSANTKRSLIWTPDASRAMALLGNTADAYGQTWHLPIDPDRKTYAELIGLAAEVGGGKIGYTVLPRFAFAVGARLRAELREVHELVPRYEVDNVFDSSKFADRFPEFVATTYRDGIREILN